MSDDLLPGLREELVRAAWRVQHRSRRRRIITTAGAVLAAASIAVVAVLAVDSSEPAAAGVEVEIVDGRINVRLTNLESRPDVVEAALRDVGLDAEVAAVPVGPSNVGRFVTGDTDLPGGVEPSEGAETTFVGFSAPVGLRDQLRLSLGRLSETDAYVIASDAYAPGEPLSCSDLYGESLAELTAFAEEHDGLEVVVQPFDSRGPLAPPLPVEDAAGDPAMSELRIADAISPAADTVTVYLTPDGQSPFPEPLSPDRGVCRE